MVEVILLFKLRKQIKLLFFPPVPLSKLQLFAAIKYFYGDFCVDHYPAERPSDNP